jgi:hypothetical protein
MPTIERENSITLVGKTNHGPLSSTKSASEAVQATPTTNRTEETGVILKTRERLSPALAEELASALTKDLGKSDTPFNALSSNLTEERVKALLDDE